MLAKMQQRSIVCWGTLDLEILSMIIAYCAYRPGNWSSKKLTTRQSQPAMLAEGVMLCCAVQEDQDAAAEVGPGDAGCDSGKHHPEETQDEGIAQSSCSSAQASSQITSESHNN